MNRTSLTVLCFILITAFTQATDSAETAVNPFPRPGTSWQWQLEGKIDTSVRADMYDIDLYETPRATIRKLKSRNIVVICYFSAGTWENWRTDAARFPKAVIGSPMTDWPDESWLDIRRIDILAALIGARLDLAKEKGCDGVEPDNVDGYINSSGFPLTSADQLKFNRWLAAQAHARGLSVGLKNDTDQIPDLVGNFDWALNEQCFEYDECDALKPFIRAGKAVFGVEYHGDPKDFCPKANTMNFDWLYKDMALTSKRHSCR